MDSSNRYTNMQRSVYEREGYTGNMNKENHGQHNSNPDYWNILVKDTEDPSFLNKKGLDFGCGCGRNVQNIVKRFNRMDGVDIASELIKQCRINLSNDGYDETRAKFYTCDGVSLSCIESDQYDFLMSTIVLQHICVHEIRYNYLKEFFRVMKSGGILSIQMGYGTGHPTTRDYYDNYYDAQGTNSVCDTRVTDPSQIVKDLESVGFSNITYTIRNSWCDAHTEWIYVRAVKA